MRVLYLTLQTLNLYEPIAMIQCASMVIWHVQGYAIAMQLRQAGKQPCFMGRIGLRARMLYLTSKLPAPAKLTRARVSHFILPAADGTWLPSAGQECLTTPLKMNNCEGLLSSISHQSMQPIVNREYSQVRHIHWGMKDESPVALNLTILITADSHSQALLKLAIIGNKQ